MSASSSQQDGTTSVKDFQEALRAVWNTSCHDEEMNEEFNEVRKQIVARYCKARAGNEDVDPNRFGTYAHVIRFLDSDGELPCSAELDWFVTGAIAKKVKAKGVSSLKFAEALRKHHRIAPAVAEVCGEEAKEVGGAASSTSGSK